MPKLKSRVRLEHLVSKKGITNTHKKTTELLIKLLLSGYLLSRRELNTIARCFDINHLLKYLQTNFYTF